MLRRWSETVSLGLLACVLTAAGATSAEAQPAPLAPPAETGAPADPVAPAPAPVPDGIPPAGEDDGKKKKKKKKEAESEALPSDASPASASESPAVEVRGRVFARGAYEDQVTLGGTGEESREGLTLTVPTARVGLKARAFDFVTLVIEADFSPKPTVKDAFVQAKKKRWAVRAGQFKMPISAWALESPWNLPLARRGILQDMLADAFVLVGRRPGVTGILQGGGSLDPALTLGVFQGVGNHTSAGDPLPDPKPLEHTYVGRFSVTPSGQEIAAVAQVRTARFPAENNASQRYWSAGVDSTLDFEFETTALRLWLEALVGSSWIDKVYDLNRVMFVTGRALGAFRFGGLTKGDSYIEPFASLGVLEPDTKVVDDLFLEVMGGLNLGYWRSVRLTLQLEYAKTARNAPQLLWSGNNPIKEHMAGMLQIGAAF